MNADDIRTFATVTEAIAHEVSEAGAVPSGDLRDALEDAVSNPVYGFGRVCGLAVASGIDPYRVASSGDVLDLTDTNAVELTPEEQGTYRLCYAQAVASRERASEEIGVAEAASELGVSEMRVRQLVRDGRLEARKLGGTWRVKRSSVSERAAGRGRRGGD